MNFKSASRKIEQAIRKGVVLELIYRIDNGSKFYFVAAPVCIRENNGRQYLMALDHKDWAIAFDIARISAMSEYWATFSIDVEFNVELFADKVFSEGNYQDGYIFLQPPCPVEVK